MSLKRCSNANTNRILLRRRYTNILVIQVKPATSCWWVHLTIHAAGLLGLTRKAVWLRRRSRGGPLHKRMSRITIAARLRLLLLNPFTYIWTPEPVNARSSNSHL